jgi:hypothetical protein
VKGGEKAKAPVNAAVVAASRSMHGHDSRAGSTKMYAVACGRLAAGHGVGRSLASLCFCALGTTGLCGMPDTPMDGSWHLLDVHLPRIVSFS